MPSQQITDHKPKSLAEYIEIVEFLQRDSIGALWYRGASKLSNQLLPSLYRKRANPDAFGHDLSQLEEQLVARFRDRSLPYHNRELVDGLETLFFMQHFGVPTRLLDWTANPFVGLFFALRTARKGDRPAVWVLDPAKWNQNALSRTSYSGGPLDPANELLSGYRQVGDMTSLSDAPVAIFGAHNSPRIVAQQGTFVIFGSQTFPMETLYRNGAFPEKSISRIVIAGSAVETLRNSIFSHGITEGAMFPDLEGLGRDLRRTFGFNS
ncbi:FRG domain-containing protein [Alloalcanivorax sp. C16-1]|uniref:FRG domain-containing protein n=1 Tax=Alloalcanivorax sp. C16-1 TaxID=3390051 RepID=UPI003970EE7F